MSRIKVWVCMSGGGLAYWGAVYRFDFTGVDHFAGPLWFGGMALALHWITNRPYGVDPSASGAGR